MRCIRPLKASFDRDGDITHRSRQGIAGLVPFEFECRKCLPCRLNNAREKAVRCVHEAQMHEDSIFLTLTYDEAHLESEWLIYRDFQLFMKSLRLRSEREISYMVTGEYGERRKRPHWHAIIFGYSPSDATYKYTSETGEKVYESDEIHSIWKKGACEFGSVTIDSAGYVARYAAKKLVHGKDEEHRYHPIHKTSSKRAIGRSWIEKYWRYTFDHGFVNVKSGEQVVQFKIPRYYVDWFKKYHPEEYVEFCKGKRLEIIENAELKARKEELEHISTIINRGFGKLYPITAKEMNYNILKRKFARLQQEMKL